MNLLMVTRENQADKRYGLGRSLLPLVVELQQRGHEVTYLSQADLGLKGRQLMASAAPLIEKIVAWLPWRTGSLAVIGCALLERINMGRLAAKVTLREGYTHVHCHDPLIAGGFWLFSFFQFCNKAKWGITEHGFGAYAQAIHEEGGNLGVKAMSRLRGLERFILRRAHWVISPTQGALTQLVRDLGIDPIPPNWHVAYHAKPVMKLYCKQEARRRLGWGDAANYIVSIGRLAPLKRFPMLIEAVAKLQASNTVQLVIVGEGDHAALQNLGKQLGLANEIKFAVTDDIGLYLCAADIYVSTSLTESFGMANLEAMVAGVPAVCTAVGAVPEVMGGGAILTASDAGVIANTLAWLLQDKVAREHIAQTGKARAEAWPSIAEIADCYEKIYR